MSRGDSLLSGPHTFTLKRLRRQLDIDTFTGDPKTSGGTSVPFSCWSLEYFAEDGGDRYYYSNEKKESLREGFCSKLYDEVHNAETHIERLDALLGDLVVCNFPRQVRQLNFPTHARPDPDEEWPLLEPHELVKDAHDLLCRMPPIPLKLPDDVPEVAPEFYNEGRLPDETSISAAWQHLRVASFITTNVIRVALMVSIYRATLAGTMLDDFINTIGDLLSTASRLSTSSRSEEEGMRWFLVRAFLWSSWQRSCMLYFYSNLSSHVWSGYNDHNGHSLSLQSFFPAPGMSLQEMSKRVASLEKPAYMCSWAFELLRTEPCALGADFRRFHQRFSDVFGGESGRCLRNRSDSCRGARPDDCQRFKGMRIKDQSMHHGDCQRDCQRMIWDEASYRNVSGARAVNINESADARSLTYCEASGQTLAISHVWSHGQGGRPEAGHGMNRCLHRRYASVAGSLGCDSYWMDTPCIPEDHELRTAAILNINKVFEQSKATLICDRDLMSIDASSLTVEVRETILVTAMACDWNIRAWTFLEAFRGRNNTYALCENDVLVSLKESCDIIYHQGCIDIALLLLSVPHLLPAFYQRDIKVVNNAFVAGFLTVEESGSRISHREASRPGDDIVIWSLLLDDKVYGNAEAFWLGREGQTIQTSFLLSSAPRLKRKGLRWAPSSPAAQLLGGESTDLTYRLQAVVGGESVAGLIRKDGFQANWLMHNLTGGRKFSRAVCSKLLIEALEPEESQCRHNIRCIRKRYLKPYVWGALLRPVSRLTDPSANEGDTSKMLVGVCGTNKLIQWPWNEEGDFSWTWLGVYEWEMSEPLPKFDHVKDVLIT